MILDFVLAAVLLFLALALCVFSVRQFVYGRSHHARVLKDGGSPLLAGKFFMDFVYWLLMPLGQLMVKLKVSPHAISLVCLLFSLWAGYLAAQGEFVFAGLVWMVGSLMDTLDGLVARACGQVSAFGSVLDSVVDRVAELSIFIGLAFYFRLEPLALGMTLLALSGSLLTSYISAKGEILRISLPRGVMRRAERAVYLGLSFLLFNPVEKYFNGLAFEMPSPALIFVTLSLIGVVSTTSSIHRMLWLKQRLSQIND